MKIDYDVGDAIAVICAMGAVLCFALGNNYGAGWLLFAAIFIKFLWD